MTPQILISFDVEEFDMPLEYGFNLPPDKQLEIGFLGLEAITPLLNQSDFRATLFTTANFADHFSSSIKHLSDNHEIASHTYYHSFFEIEHLPRTQKHISDPLNKSAAKRINMMLRWFVRNDNAGVDFGIWKSLSPSQLSCPLDVHSGNVARKLGLLNRKQNDAKALKELDIALRKLDPKDPVKYDFALFGLGVFKKF